MRIVVVIAALVVALDLVSKHLVATRLVEGRLYGIRDAWGLRRVHNVGGGLMALSAPQAAVSWLVMAGCAALALAVPSQPVGTLTAVGIGTAVGGAAGNVAGRLMHGSVVDFVAAGPWPVFNLADASMVVGLALTAWSLG